MFGCMYGNFCCTIKCMLNYQFFKLLLPGEKHTILPYKKMPFYVWVFPNYVTQFMAMSAMLWLTVSATMPSKFWFFPMALMGPSLFYESLVYKLSKLHF